MSSDSRGNAASSREKEVGLIVLKSGFLHPRAERNPDDKNRAKEESLEIWEGACSWDVARGPS